MASTVRDLITGALRLINVVQTGETPAEYDIDVALSAFDQMIDSWSNEKLMVYSINPYIFNTVGGQSNYLLGPGHPILTFGVITPGSGYTDGVYSNVPLTNVVSTQLGQSALAQITVLGGIVTSVEVQNAQGAGGFGYALSDQLTASNIDMGGFGSGFAVTVATIGAGDWNIARPLRIEQMTVIWNDPTSQQATDLPVALLTDSQYSDISVKNTPSSFPFAAYDNGNYPMKTISMWPVPSVSTGLRCWLRQPLINFDNIDEVIQYPPGYERAFRFCLAVEIAPEFGKTPDGIVASTAIKAKSDLANMNADPQYTTGDGGLNKSRRSWNWITGNLVPWK